MKKERTLVLIKPDGIQRSLVGEIIQRFERIGLKLVAIKMVVPTKEMVEKHYTLDPEWIEKVGKNTIANYLEKNVNPPSNDPKVIGNTVLNNLKSYLTSGPVVAMVWEGASAVSVVRKLVGKTEPLTSDVGSIRGDYVLDSYQVADTDGRAIRNLIHASGSVEEANKEVAHWFSKKDLIKYTIIHEKILYDVNLDGILE